jgi:alkylation response protein AidB-like acyl-CoA dehydrogenase
MKFTPTALGRNEDEIRANVRAVMAANLPEGRRPALGMTGGHEPPFSARLGREGLVGLAIAAEHGGHGRRAVERFVITEELLGHGAPITAHWGSDRQIGPSIIAFGTEEQKQRLIPPIVRGELHFSLGMSEPDAGSDLASIRTAATRTEGGWLVNGTKIWTSYADRNQYFMVLCRTSAAEDRHNGMSQLMVDLRAPGVQVRPIESLDAHHHFHEVVMTDVFVPDDMVLGQVGMGWQQVMAELTLERAGPDRYMTAVPLLTTFLDQLTAAAVTAECTTTLGHLFARLWGLRHMSLSLSRSLDDGYHPNVEAALVKDMGSSFEQEVVESLRLLHESELDAESPILFDALLAEATLAAPSYTIRGGTVEILRSVASKGLAREGGRGAVGDPMLQETLERMFAERCTPEAVRDSEPAGWSPELWALLAEAGVPWIGIDESRGGSGGSFADVCAALRLVGYYAAPVPLADTAALGGWMLAESGIALPEGPVAVARGGERALTLQPSGPGWRIDGTVRRVAFASHAEQLAAFAHRGDDLFVVSVPLAAAEVRPGFSLAGESRDEVVLSEVAVDTAHVVAAPTHVTPHALRTRGAIVTATLMAGACQAAVDLSLAYTAERHQFGQAIRRFQAVQHHLVSIAGEAAHAGMVAALAATTSTGAREQFAAAAAKVAACRSARRVTSSAHQVHGAIGMTREYELQLRTRRLWGWSEEWGGERMWARELGAVVAQAGGAGLLDLVTVGPLGQRGTDGSEGGRHG